MADGRGVGEKGMEMLVVVGVEVSSGRQCHVYMPYEVGAWRQPVFGPKDVEIYQRESIPPGIVPSILAECVV
jgi:hypothetical protein